MLFIAPSWPSTFPPEPSHERPLWANVGQARCATKTTISAIAIAVRHAIAPSVHSARSSLHGLRSRASTGRLLYGDLTAGRILPSGIQLLSMIFLAAALDWIQ